MLKNKKIWIIGANSNLGKDLTLELAKSNNLLALSSRRVDALKPITESLPKDNHLILPLNVTSHSDVKAAFREIMDHWGALDAVIFGAEVYQAMSMDQFDLEFCLKTIDTNLLAAFHFVDTVVPYFITRNKGSLCFIASVAGYRGLPNSLSFGTSKAGLISLCECLRMELYPYNINVQMINSGIVSTPLPDKNGAPSPLALDKDLTSIVKDLGKNKFELLYPKRQTILLKLLKMLPYKLYFKFIRQRKMTFLRV